MNVEELIEELEQYPDNMEVEHVHYDNPTSIERIEKCDGSEFGAPRGNEFLLLI